MVGVVAVHQHIGVGVNVGKHAPHNVALALQRHVADDGTRLPRYLDRAVSRIIVKNIDAGFWQGKLETAHNTADGNLFVVAGDQDCNALRGLLMRLGMSLGVGLGHFFKKARKPKSTVGKSASAIGTTGSK